MCPIQCNANPQDLQHAATDGRREKGEKHPANQKPRSIEFGGGDDRIGRKEADDDEFLEERKGSRSSHPRLKVSLAGAEQSRNRLDTRRFDG